MESIIQTTIYDVDAMRLDGVEGRAFNALPLGEHAVLFGHNVYIAATCDQHFVDYDRYFTYTNEDGEEVEDDVERYCISRTNAQF